MINVNYEDDLCRGNDDGQLTVDIRFNEVKVEVYIYENEPNNIEVGRFTWLEDFEDDEKEEFERNFEPGDYISYSDFSGWFEED